MKRILICFICLCLPLACFSESQTIYKTTDDQGNVLFTDKPAKGATEIEIAPVQSYSTPSAPAATDATGAQIPPNAAPGEHLAYDSITLVEPAVDDGGDGATVWSNPGTLNVTVSLHPTLQPGDKMQILIDGASVAESGDVTNFTINDVYPGAHTLAAQVLGADGTVLITSDTRKIYMHRIGLNSPQYKGIPQGTPPTVR